MDALDPEIFAIFPSVGNRIAVEDQIFQRSDRRLNRRLDIGLIEDEELLRDAPLLSTL